MGSSLLERQIEKRPDKVKLQGRVLFLTEDPELVKRQLAGEDLAWDTKNPASNPKLRDDISTDEITPAHYCFYFDETLGESGLGRWRVMSAMMLRSRDRS